MKNRRGFLLTCVTGFVAMALVVGTVIADELLGVITKVDPDAKKITVMEKDTDKEVVVTITDETVVATKKGEMKVDLEKLETKFKRYQDEGKKIRVKVTHEKGVASKIEYPKKPKAEQ